MSRTPRTAGWLVLAMSLSACGPTIDLSIRVRQEPANVMYGAPPAASIAPLGPRPTVPTTGTSAPGFIAPPVFTGDFTGEPGSDPDTTAGGNPRKPTVPGVGVPVSSCPKAPLDAVPSEAAPATVRGAPMAGTYTYRRDAALKGGANPTELGRAAPVKLPTELTRTVQAVQTVPGTEDGGDQTTYEVVSEEGGVRSITSWLIVSPVNGDAAEAGSAGPSGPGMYIRRIETTVTEKDGKVGLDVFQPTPPVKVLDLPFVPQVFDTTPAASRGIDPITGATLDLFHATEGQVTVDVCGTPYRAWRVRLGQEVPSASGPSRVVNEYTHPFKHGWKFTGTIDVLPQFGGIIAQDSFHFFEGIDDRGGRFDLRSDSTLTAPKPKAAR